MWEWLNMNLPIISEKDAGIFATVVAIICLPIVALGSHYYLNDWLIPAIIVGALGGLSHELVQSQGKYMLPACDDKGNYCLGGLVGLLEGGIAGVILLQGQTIPIANPQTLLISAFLAGLALKGVSDSVNNFPTTDEKVAAAQKAATAAKDTATAKLAAANAEKDAAAEKAAADAGKKVETDQKTAEAKIAAAQSMQAAAHAEELAAHAVKKAADAQNVAADATLAAADKKEQLQQRGLS
jgi:hypothetical protein